MFHCWDIIHSGEIPVVEIPTDIQAPLPDTKPPSDIRTAFDNPQKKEEVTYGTQEERVEAFKSLLSQAVQIMIAFPNFQGVTSTWTWDMTMRAIINDDRLLKVSIWLTL